MNECTGKVRTLKQKKGTCIVRFCAKHALARRDRTGKRYKYCAKHRRQRQKETDPIGYFFDALRQNARRRKVGFHLSKKEFAVFCAETDYIRLKGRYKNDMTIDREIPALGYRYGNLQLLTRSKNSSKGNQERAAPGEWQPVETIEAF